MLRAGKAAAKLGQPSLPTGENNRFISRCNRFISFHMLPNGSQRDSCIAFSPFFFQIPQAAAQREKRTRFREPTVNFFPSNYLPKQAPCRRVFFVGCERISFNANKLSKVIVLTSTFPGEAF